METAKTLSERFGKVLQKRQSISINRQDVSHSINTQMDSLIPASKDFHAYGECSSGGERQLRQAYHDQKIFHAEIVVDTKR